jgi:hypothetical protein
MVVFHGSAGQPNSKQNQPLGLDSMSVGFWFFFISLSFVFSLSKPKRLSKKILA